MLPLSNCRTKRSAEAWTLILVGAALLPYPPRRECGGCHRDCFLAATSAHSIGLDILTCKISNAVFNLRGDVGACLCEGLGRIIFHEKRRYDAF